jgi:folate-binding protein YgfZ
MASVTAQLQTARRPRAFVRAAGPDAADYLQRMLSNDVVALEPGSSCEALLLTPKARVVAPVRVLRRADDDFLLLTEPELGESLRAALVRMRFAAKVNIELERHDSTLVLGAEAPAGAIPNADYGIPAYELIDAAPPAGARALRDDELEALRIAARTPRFGREIDERVLPAEAGLVERAVSFTKGCYPGQEPVARLRYRGHANRELRTLLLDDEPEYDAELSHGGKVVGRVTSSVRTPEGVLALAYVRVEVPPDAELAVGDRPARQLH